MHWRIWPNLLSKPLKPKLSSQTCVSFTLQGSSIAAPAPVCIYLGLCISCSFHYLAITVAAAAAAVAAVVVAAAVPAATPDSNAPLSVAVDM